MLHYSWQRLAEPMANECSAPIRQSLCPEQSLSVGIRHCSLLWIDGVIHVVLGTKDIYKSWCLDSGTRTKGTSGHMGEDCAGLALPHSVMDAGNVAVEVDLQARQAALGVTVAR
jgi:hypothetical protein